MTRTFFLFLAILVGPFVCTAEQDEAVQLEGSGFRLLVDAGGGGFRLEDRKSGVVWSAGPFQARLAGEGWKRLEGLGVRSRELPGGKRIISCQGDPVSFSFALDRRNRSLRISCQYGQGSPGVKVEAVRLLPEISLSSGQDSYLIVPVREGLLIPSDGGPPFRRSFGTSQYEGCHLNMIGLVNGPGAAMITWDDAYLTPQAARIIRGDERRLALSAEVSRSARSLLFTPLGMGSLQEIAAAYRELAAEKGLRVTLRQKMEARPELERLIGATNFKLWTCLRRRMSEDSKKEESVEVRWTFPQAARVAEHLKQDLQIDRCLFTVSGWIHRGYDCQHPDILPAAPECGGNRELRAALEKIRALGYADSLHDNYQDIYRDSPSWDESLIMKRPGGKLAMGGRWLGGRAYLVCAPRSLELARRPQNLPEVKKLFRPLTYFIDTTYAVGPQECVDPLHPLSRNDDIRWKIALSDYARELFGIFGSECGREWAIPHSDFFEGLVGVSGRYFHNLDPGSLGALVIPFFEMIYHDCQLAWGKYGFDPDKADEYVLHHVACARPLHHHGIPRGLYWENLEGDPPARGAFTRADGGWAEGLHRTDRFLKNTQEVLGPLHRATAFEVLERIEFLSPDRSLRRLVYGKGKVVILCNFGKSGAAVKSSLGERLCFPALDSSPNRAIFWRCTPSAGAGSPTKRGRFLPSGVWTGSRWRGPDACACFMALALPGWSSGGGRWRSTGKQSWIFQERSKIFIGYNSNT